MTTANFFSVLITLLTLGSTAIAKKSNCVNFTSDNRNVLICADSIQNLGISTNYNWLTIQIDDGLKMPLITFQGEMTHTQNYPMGLWLTAQKLCNILTNGQNGFERIVATAWGKPGIFLQADNSLMHPVLTATDDRGNIVIPGTNTLWSGGGIKQLRCLNR